MGRYEEGESGDLPGLRLGMIADFFQQRLKSERRKGKKSEGRCLRRGKEMKSRSEAVEEEREEIAEESSEREKGEQREVGE